MINLKKIITYLLILLTLFSLVHINNNKFSHNAQAEDINLKTVFADISEKNSPAVVKVKSTSQKKEPDFEFYEYITESDEQTTVTGTGFIIKDSGYILTNKHLVDQASEININLDGNRFPAEKIGSDFNLDLALLKIDTDKELPTVELAPSDDLRPGDWVIAIGNPHGYQRITTSGIISALNRSIDLQENGHSRNYNNLIQTDAAINPGNSGGPLLNIHGEVIGINTAIDTEKQNVSYAVPSSEFTNAITEIKEHGKVLRPWTGLHVQEISKEVSEFMGLDNSERVLISAIDSDSPADKAGVQAGDIIIEFKEETIKNSDDFRQQVDNIEIDQEIELIVFRDNEKEELSLKINEMP